MYEVWFSRQFGLFPDPTDMCYTLLSGIFTPITATTLTILRVQLQRGIVRAMDGLIRQISPHWSSNTVLYSICGTFWYSYTLYRCRGFT